MRSFLPILLSLTTTAIIVASPGLAEGKSATEVLDGAFESRFGADMTAEIELTMRDRSGREHRRMFEAASKMIDGKMHSVGKLNWPNYLRNMTILTIEADERDHDAFVYMPSLERIRRISSAQRGDAFFGTDITYEDLERRHADEFRIDVFESALTNGEESHHIQATPLEKMTFSKVDYFIAKADLAVLETRFYRGDSEEPYRIVHTDREKMVSKDSFILPTVIVVENLDRRTITTAIFRNLRINPEIDERLFSTSVLQRNPSLRTHSDLSTPAFNPPESSERDAR
ncbi:MAG: outer membrane lipoprotein-sorting protein [Myxococcota bacterium]|nr:outer membrane lipoprotein-sorting protein [Myxococcota bacterium]